MSDFNWSDLPGYGTDPSAGMPDWSNAVGQMPTDFQIPDSSQNLLLGLPDLGSGGAGLIQRLLAGKNGAPKTPAENLADLSSVFGAFSSGEKANRFMQGNFTQNYDRLMLDAEKNRNATESDAMKKLAQTSYIMGGGSKFKAPSLTLNGKHYNIPDLGYGPVAPTAPEISGATDLQSQLGARLKPGGTYTPQPLSDYAKPGVAENIGSYGAAGVGGIGAISSLINPGGTPGGQSDGNGVGSDIAKGIGTAGSIATLASKFLHPAASAAGAGTAGAGAASGALGTIGKFAGPVAGAALGAYALGKNQSVGSDTLAGAGAGASIGSLAGPIGTAVGAGVGALVGALRGAFSVTAKEQGGRDAQTAIAQNLSKLSTPQQQAESKQSGWPDPNQALSLIVMRDALIKQGLPPAQAEAKAEASMHSIWDAEKRGAEDVNQAGSSISSMLGRG